MFACYFLKMFFQDLICCLYFLLTPDHRSGSITIMAVIKTWNKLVGCSLLLHFNPMPVNSLWKDETIYPYQPAQTSFPVPVLPFDGSSWFSSETLALPRQLEELWRLRCLWCKAGLLFLVFFFTLSQCLYRAVAFQTPSWSVPVQQPHDIPGFCVTNISQAKTFLHSKAEWEHSRFLISLACTYRNEDGEESRY